MYAMQYEITLPADYDMGIIRNRVATKGHLLDDFPGLGLKAYLVRDRGRDGSPVNQYSPFYLWVSTAGMSRFLWGGHGFSALTASFGRPAVRTWTGLGVRRGPSFGAAPDAASRFLEVLSADADPEAAVACAEQLMEERARHPRVTLVACGLDPGSWQLVQFTLWTGGAPEIEETRYEVLHLCRPELAAIAP